VPGKAAAGRVFAVGPGVSTFKPGDRVAVQVEYGAYAEKVVTGQDRCYPVADDIPFDKAAALGLAYQTAWFALKERAAFRKGETVLVLGASGGVGFASVQLAKAFGANKVIAGVRGEANAAVARLAGADDVIALSGDALTDTLRADVKAMTGGRGADIIIDPVGGAANAAALRALAWGGRLVVIGFASGEIATLKTNYLLVKNIAVSGLQWSDYRDRMPQLVTHAQAEIFDLFRQGKVDPYISRKTSLENFAEALAAFKGGKAQGKIILQVQGE
jgi:NADPH2:quinone reductase